MATKLATVGLQIPGFSDSYLPLRSDQSLLDYDLIVFNPDITGLCPFGSEYHQGKPCLSDTASFILKEKATRWRQELGTAFKHGKTVFIYLPEFVEVFVATGSVDFSGSGRNRVTTRHVAPFDNFKLLPIGLDNVTSARGREMKPARKLGVLASYWADFGAASQYEVYFDSKVVTSLVVTKTGHKTVAGVISAKPGSGGGAIFYLPPVKFDQAEFTEQKDGKAYWTKSALTFGRKWISALTAIDATVAAETQQTPEPDWVKTTQFQLQNRIAEATARLERMEAEKRALEDELTRRVASAPAVRDRCRSRGSDSGGAEGLRHRCYGLQRSGL